jgi:proline iminopeptidase
MRLLADMERLRAHLGLDRWVLTGGSWGSTLLLAYAERHPRRVSEIVISGVTTTRRYEIDWLFRGLARFFPAEWERFLAGVPPAERDRDLLAAYARLLDSPDSAVRARAARDWHAWEDATVSLQGSSCLIGLQAAGGLDAGPSRWRPRYPPCSRCAYDTCAVLVR